DEWAAKRADEVERQITAAQNRLQELRVRLGDATPAARVSSSASTALVPAEEVLSAEGMALRAVQQELAQALTRFTEAHPHVQELRASIAALQKEITAQTSIV